jgi:hypothetical protein
MRVWAIVSDGQGRDFDTLFRTEVSGELGYLVDAPDTADVITSFDELDFGKGSAVETVAERYEPAWSSTDDEQVLWLESHLDRVFADSANT